MGKATALSVQLFYRESITIPHPEFKGLWEGIDWRYTAEHGPSPDGPMDDTANVCQSEAASVQNLKRMLGFR